MGAATQSIVHQLHECYYAQDKTPQNLVSSHWKDMHAHAKVETSGDGFKLDAIGFGDLGKASIFYQALSWVTVATYMTHLKDRGPIAALIPAGLKVAKRMGLPFTYDCFRQVCSVALLKKYLDTQKEIRMVVIGDGYGFFSCLFKDVFPLAKITFIDLGKTLLFQAHYAGKAYPKSSHHLISLGHKQFDLNADFVYSPAEWVKDVDMPLFDVAVNIASMQEMNSATVSFYFDFLRRHLKKDNLFYCCNREEKIMPGGEISRLKEYPWQSNDKVLLDGPCPWHQYYLARHRTLRGMTLWGWRVPLVNYFDGMILHRLSVLNTGS